MMFLNFFGAIPLLLPNIVWNVITIVYIIKGEEYGYMFQMGWDHVLEEDHVHYKDNSTRDDGDIYMMKEQKTCKIVSESIQIRIFVTVVLAYLLRQSIKDKKNP